VVSIGACKKPPPVVVSPREIEAPQPDPARVSETAAATQGKSGAVRVRYCIDTEGRTRDVEIVESLEPEIDAVVAETVEGWRYEPGKRDGQAVESCTDYTFMFDFSG